MFMLKSSTDKCNILNIYNATKYSKVSQKNIYNTEYQYYKN